MFPCSGYAGIQGGKSAPDIFHFPSVVGRDDLYAPTPDGGFCPVFLNEVFESLADVVGFLKNYFSLALSTQRGKKQGKDAC
jgi:hypothetical protein